MSSYKPERTLRRKPEIENLRPQRFSTHPSRPEEARHSYVGGLDELREKFGGMKIDRSYSNAGAYRPKLGKSYLDRIPNRFESPPPSAAIPRRKQVPADIMSIPVYDNGTHASYGQAQRLRQLEKGVPARSEYAIPSRSSSSRQKRSSYNAYQYSGYTLPSDQVQGSNKSQVTKTSTSRIDKYRNKPLPATPRDNSQKEARNRMLHKRSHELLLATGTAGVTMKAPQFQLSSTTIGKRGGSKDADKRSEMKARDAVSRHNDTLQQAKAKQASQTRLLNAQRAFDSGRSNMYKTCPEIEILTKEEKEQFSDYVRTKLLKSGIVEESQRPATRNGGGGQGKKGKQKDCIVM